LSMADNIMTFRYVVKEVAIEEGVRATFMPKPFSDQAGSAALMARAAEAAPPSTSLEVHGKQEEEEVDLDSSLIWAIRYLECDAVEEMLSEGANI